MIRMRRVLTGLIAALAAGGAANAADVDSRPKVRVQTSQGAFVVQLDAERAPITVRNFLEYVESGHYEGTIFHRVIAGFVVQGGGVTPELAEKRTRDPIPNESGNGLSNTRGTIAMARTEDPHSATSQFYINLKDNLALNPSEKRWGYCVFGAVVEGMDVVDKIAAMPTGPRGEIPSDVPEEDIVVQKMELVLPAT
jgi:cyclophilin family peptidyl-prolyl cis-trans isomerase